MNEKERLEKEKEMIRKAKKKVGEGNISDENLVDYIINDVLDDGVRSGEIVNREQMSSARFTAGKNGVRDNFKK